MSHYVSIRQAVAERPWLTERYARRLIYENRVAFSKVGGKVLVDLDDVDRIVAEGRREARAS